MANLQLLTRAGCRLTVEFRRNLDAALEATVPVLTCAIVNIDLLPIDDLRRGYPTPTLLWRGRDVCGLPTPVPPLPTPP